MGISGNFGYSVTSFLSFMEALISCVLPSDLLDHFVITSVSQELDDKTGKPIIEVNLEEKNTLPEGYTVSHYESKGFFSGKRVQDFPLRGKALYLIFKRRRWRHKETGEQLTADYSFVAQGTKLTAELAAFLKGTGRDPRRYDR